MGSCLSRKGALLSNKDKQSPVPTRAPTAELPPNGPAPPPPPPPPSPLDDEAVVKEVLTETPLPSVHTTTGTKPKSAVVAPDEAAPAPSAVDEVCSVSESFSASTSVVGEGMEEAETADSVPVAAKRRPRELCQAGKGHHQRKRSVSGEFPSWREARGGGGGRSFSGREATRASLQQVRNHGYVSARVVRGDPGEKSGRRSASPAARRETNLRAARERGGRGGVGSCSSTRRASPRWSPPPQRRTTASGVSREMGSGVEEDVEEEEGGQLGAAALPGTEPEESLENPLVSLECFIFL